MLVDNASTVFGSGDSIQRSVNRQPAGASTEGCSEFEPHSMKNGSTPLLSSCKVSDFQVSVVPSGRAREPGFGPTHSTPAPLRVEANSSTLDRWTAHPTRAGLFRVAT